MLSIGRSRLALPSQLAFHALNGLGLLIGCFYNRSTPDLYENNAHHKLGWIVTWTAVAWTLLAVLSRYMPSQPSSAQSHSRVLSVGGQSVSSHHRLVSADSFHWPDSSGDAANRDFTPFASPLSSRNGSWGAATPENEGLPDGRHADDQYEALPLHDADDEKNAFLEASHPRGSLARHASSILGNARVNASVSFVHVLLERFLVILSFLAIITGLVTYSGIGRGNHVFNILAHLIKGGIFFWYGLATFGRWMGGFADIGWAWNVKPPADMVGKFKARVPSAEFIESFVIFLYGASNVFLEHLGAWGKAWSPMDFEHVSITIMFFGGGLLGMLIESGKVRNALNAADYLPVGDVTGARSPSSYVHPLNPIPSLVILLLGIMMSNHTQHSLVAGQVHRQWGLLFAGFAAARILTYGSFWLKPPTSYLPTRPPTELLASFCLVSGGLLFMASNKDTINAMEEYGLDSMFTFTVMMGWTCLIMAWVMTVLAVKSWAARKSRKSSPFGLSASPA